MNFEENNRLYNNTTGNKVMWFIAIGLALLVFAFTINGATAYIGGSEHAVDGYMYTEDGKFEVTGSIPRGSEVARTFTKQTYNGVDMRLVRYNGEDYFVDDNCLYSNDNNLVVEKEVYVRTSAVIYENEEGPEIASFMKKGSRMDVLGYDKLRDDGYVNKYKVAYTDVTGESGEGYVYGKYMVGTEKAAKKHYNKNGEYDNAKKAKFSYNLYGGKATNLDFYPYEKTAIEGKIIPEECRTMYINTWAAVNPEDYVKLIKKTDCNAVVIDIKDGSMTYQSDIVKETSKHSYKDSYATEEEFRAGVQAYKDTGVWTIGRVVVFNDSRYAKDHPEHCIKSPGYKSWPSAYSREVWEYNVKIAREAVEKFGFDEIQFDYVRFPESSYSMSQIKKTKFRNKYKEDKCEAVQGFCFYAADQLREVGAYISVDVFGESSYGYVTAYGQYWPAISNIVDAISAMPYTDHTGGEGAWNHPYRTVRNWAKTAAREQKKTPCPAIPRTWITGYDTPYWNITNDYGAKELKDQVKALKKEGLTGGFIPWNVGSSLGKYEQYKTVWNK